MARRLFALLKVGMTAPIWIVRSFILQGVLSKLHFTGPDHSRLRRRHHRNAAIKCKGDKKGFKKIVFRKGDDPDQDEHRPCVDAASQQAVNTAPVDVEEKEKEGIPVGAQEDADAVVSVEFTEVGVVEIFAKP